MKSAAGPMDARQAIRPSAVTDDWPEDVPETEAESDVFEAWVAHLSSCSRRATDWGNTIAPFVPPSPFRVQRSCTDWPRKQPFANRSLAALS